MREELAEILSETGALADGKPVPGKREILARYRAVRRDTPQGKRLAGKLEKKMELRYLDRTGSTPKAARLKIKTARPLERQESAFIDAEGKFGVVGAPELKNRRVVSTADFSRMTAVEREAVFVTDHPIFRSGDTVIKDRRAFVVTGLQADTRLIAYAVDTATRAKDHKRWLSIGAGMTKVTCDVLGRRLYGRGKNSGDIQPVPYPLRGG